MDAETFVQMVLDVMERTADDPDARDDAVQQITGYLAVSEAMEGG